MGLFLKISVYGFASAMERKDQKNNHEMYHQNLIAGETD